MNAYPFPVRIRRRARPALLAGFLAAVLLAVPALAQVDPASPQERPAPALPLKLKSGGEALSLSFVCTAVPLFLSIDAALGAHHDQTALTLATIGGVASLVAGPSVGDFYGGLTERAWISMGVRAALALLMLPGDGLAGVGLMLLTAAAAVEIVYVPFAVHARNEMIKKSALTVAPVIIPDKKGAGAGIQISYSF